MREIKFRIWNKKKKEWVHSPGYEPNLFGETILLGEFMKVSIEELNSCVALQYTGLKDKNGKEIYEGDIIQKTGYNLAAQFTYGIEPNGKHWSQIGQLYVVVYLNSGFTLIPDYTFKNSKIDNIIPNIFGNIGQYNFWNGASSATEIIGNIYENPDLIK